MILLCSKSFVYFFVSIGREFIGCVLASSALRTVDVAFFRFQLGFPKACRVFCWKSSMHEINELTTRPQFGVAFTFHAKMGKDRKSVV